MAPEVLSNNNNNNDHTIYTESCDVWSFGVILYQLLTKKKPFEGNNLELIVKRILYYNLNFQEDRLKNYSNDLINIVK